MSENPCNSPENREYSCRKHTKRLRAAGQLEAFVLMREWEIRTSWRDIHRRRPASGTWLQRRGDPRDKLRRTTWRWYRVPRRWRCRRG